MGYDRRFDSIAQQPITALLAADGVTPTRIGQAYQRAALRNREDLRFTDAKMEKESEGRNAAVPSELTLSPNYPNPFSLATAGIVTHIPYALPKAGAVELRVYDLLGRLTRQVTRGQQNAGWHQATWDGRDESGIPVRSGMYFLVLQAGEQKLTRKLMVAK